MRRRMSRQISKAINKKIDEIISETAEKEIKAPSDLASLQEKVFQLELQQEVVVLRDMLNDPATFIHKFKERCALRQPNTDSSIPFSAMSESPANRLYFDIANILFEPAFLTAILAIIMPDIKQQLLVSIPEVLPPMHQQHQYRDYIKHHLQPHLTLSSLGRLTDEPKIENLAHYVFSDNILFNLEDIAAFPLPIQVRLYSALQSKFEKLSEKIYSHNAAWQALANDAQTYQNKGLAPKVVIEHLIKGFRLQGEHLSGRPETNDAIMSVLQPFFSYFDELPADIKAHLLALKSGFSTINNVIEEKIKKGHCVESTAEILIEILEANSQDKVLTTQPIMSADSLRQLERKYQTKNSPSVLDVKKDALPLLKLPEKLTKQALQLMNLESLEDIIILLLSFPVDYYAMLFEQIDSDEMPDFLDGILDAISYDFFNMEQIAALANAFKIHYSRLDKMEIPLLHWAVAGKNIVFVKQLLAIMSDAEKTNAINAKDDNDNTLLHLVSEEPELLKLILDIYPEHKRLIAVKEENIYGCTVLHYAANSPESIKMILKLYPEAERFEALKQKNGYDLAVLDLVFSYPEPFIEMLILLPEADQLNFLRTLAGRDFLFRDTVLNGIVKNVDFNASVASNLMDSSSFAFDFIRMYLVLSKNAVSTNFVFFNNPNLASKLLDQIDELHTFTDIKKQVFNCINKNKTNEMTAALFSCLQIKGDSEEEKLKNLQQRWDIVTEPSHKKLKFMM